jgi:hypothetical protein
MGSVRRTREDSPSYARVSNFMGLFTHEETAEWARVGHAPDWVVSAICWFMDQEPAHRRLMEMLAEDD